MRAPRRLPPFLRVVSVFGLLFPLTSLVLYAAWLVSSITSWFMLLQAPGNSERFFVIAGNLTMLGVACVFPINSYSLRVRQADSGGPVLLDEWQRQARALALLRRSRSAASYGLSSSLRPQLSSRLPSSPRSVER